MVDGLPGDVVALALPLDIMKIEEAGLINPGWQVSNPAFLHLEPSCLLHCCDLKELDLLQSQQVRGIPQG